MVTLHPENPLNSIGTDRRRSINPPALSSYYPAVDQEAIPLALFDRRMAANKK